MTFSLRVLSFLYISGDFLELQKKGSTYSRAVQKAPLISIPRRLSFRIPVDAKKDDTYKSAALWESRATYLKYDKDRVSTLLDFLGTDSLTLTHALI